MCCAVNVWIAEIGERNVLVSEIKAWEQQRNSSGARVKWKFTTQKARDKLARAYPDTAKDHNHCAEVLGRMS